MTRPALLVFDVFGTVVDWRASLVTQIPGILEPHGLVVEEAAFADAWRALYQPSMEAVRCGARPWVSLDVLHRESLDTLLARHGGSALPEPAREALNGVWHRLDPWPDAVTGLAALRRIGFCCALSNGNVRMMASIARHAGLVWDQILGGEWSRAYKPMPKVYLDAVEVFGLRPDQVMMVAAHNADLHAAHALGLRTAFVLRPREYGAEQTTDLAPEGPWTHVATDFDDLARQLAGESA